MLGLDTYQVPKGYRPFLDRFSALGAETAELHPQTPEQHENHDKIRLGEAMGDIHTHSLST